MTHLIHYYSPVTIKAYKHVFSVVEGKRIYSAQFRRKHQNTKKNIKYHGRYRKIRRSSLWMRLFICGISTKSKNIATEQLSARLMLEGGCDIYTLSKMMGHSKITTIYLPCRNQQMGKAIELHALN